MAVDILFLSWERPEFTQVALRCLFQNTDWSQVNKLVVYDDGSSERARKSLAHELFLGPTPSLVTDVRYRERFGPPGIMLDYLSHDPADVFIKIDNDIAVPQGWLEALVSVWDDEIELLGMEIGHPHGLSVHMGLEEGERTWVPTRHIGGVGMMRTSAFAKRKPMEPSGRNGFTEWQHTHKPKRGWIFPEINAPCLDRIPVAPFSDLSTEYVRRGWQREWWQYPLDAHRYWDWLLEEEVWAA